MIGGESTIEHLKGRVAELQQERDALAAHVERLRIAWVDAKRCVSVVAFPSLYHVEQYQGLAKASIKKLETAFAEQPATSLARRDAKSAYDAVYTATVIMNSLEASEYLVDLRQQAKELIDD